MIRVVITLGLVLSGPAVALTQVLEAPQREENLASFLGKSRGTIESLDTSGREGGADRRSGWPSVDNNAILPPLAHRLQHNR